MGAIYLNRLASKNIKDYVTESPGKFDRTTAVHIKLNNEIVYEFQQSIIFNQFQVGYWLWMIYDGYTGLYPIIEFRDANKNIVLSIGYFPYYSSFIINGTNLGRNESFYGSKGYWMYCCHYYHNGIIYTHMNDGGIRKQYSYANKEIKYISIGGIGHMEDWGAPYARTSGYNLCKTYDMVLFYDNDCNNSNVYPPSNYHLGNYVNYSLYENNKELYGM